MPSFSQDILLFILGLLLFGPKKLPVLARQVGKWMAEFRRASNEFKMQMDEELRLSEQVERQAKIAAMEAAAPAAVLEAPTGDGAATINDAATTDGIATTNIDPEDPHPHFDEAPVEPASDPAPAVERVDGVRPIPIATSGELSIMPPATGLPVAQTASRTHALDSLLDSIPATEPDAAANSTETTEHGD
jgi:sec-independent protein translocase protein TatB